MLNLEEAFDKASDENEYLKFERVENPPHPRPDICAFIILDKLQPAPGRDMVSWAEHDEIWLDIDCQALASVATYEDIVTLHRCGVRYDVDTDSLTMFV